MRVLVTGGAGYLGTVVCEVLAGAGCSVRCLDVLAARDHFRAASPREGRPAVQWIGASITDPAAVRQALLGCDAVVHLAGLSSDGACARNPDLARAVNLEGALLVARLARTHGCSRFLHASSCSVYGAGGEELLTESAEPRPLSLYARYKLKAEAELDRLAAADFTLVHLRQATLFGYSPHLRKDLVVNAMTVDALRRGRILVHGGGGQWRPFLHVRDAASAFLAVLRAPVAAVRGEIFNVGADSANHRVDDIARIVCGEVPGTAVIRLPGAADARSYRVGFGKIAERLGWQPSLAVPAGVVELKERLLYEDDPVLRGHAGR